MSSGERRADQQSATKLAHALGAFNPVAGALIVRLIDDYARRHRYATLPADVRRLRDVAADVAADAHRGPADVRTLADSARWPQDEITTKEAAELMRCTREHVVRLARAGRLGQTRVAAGRRLVSRAAVEAFVIEKERSA